VPNEIAHILCNGEIEGCLEMRTDPVQDSGQEDFSKGGEMNKRKERKSRDERSSQKKGQRKGRGQQQRGRTKG